MAPSNTDEYVPFSSSSLPMRRTNPSVDRITPEPMLARRTPSFSRSGIGGDPDVTQTLNGPPTTVTQFPHSPPSLTPGPDTPSAPPLPYAHTRAAWRSD